MPSKRSSTRREFLKGQSAAKALADMAGSLLPEPETASSPAPSAAGAVEPYLIHFGRRAMACQFELYFNAGQYDEAASRAVEALDLIDELEARLSAFRPDSELSVLNSRAAAAPVVVSQELFKLLDISQDLCEETDGAVDVAAGTLVSLWSVCRRQGTIPEPAALQVALESSGMRHVQLDPASRTAQFDAPGVQLNLGAVGKGFALDCAASQLESAGIHDFLWHGGNSSVLARGSAATNLEGERGWRIGIAHPLRPEQRLAEVVLEDAALATSGSRVQSYRHAGKRYGHIIDPRSGWPADRVLSATVVARTAAEADALSTALFVMGAERAGEFCSQRADITAWLTVPSPAGHGIEVVAHGSQALDWRAVD